MPDEKNVQRTERDEEHDASTSPQTTGDVYNTEDYLAAEFEADAEHESPTMPDAADYNRENDLDSDTGREREPLPSEEDTEDMPSITDEQLQSLTGPRNSSASKPDRHEMPTLPLPEESSTTDPRHTLPGSGGFDPNPDFN